MPETGEVATLETEDEKVLEDEAGDGAEGKQRRQQQQQQQHGNCGMQVLCGEIQEYDPAGDNPRPFE